MKDADVRTALHESVLALHHYDHNTRVIDEMGVWSGTARIDVAVINGEICGYEIKSDRDTLERLPHQIEIYSKIFDRLTLVVGKKHEAKATSLIPEWWGVTVAEQKSGKVTLRRRRTAKKNRNIDYKVLCEQLWKSEALELLEKYDTRKGWQSRKRSEVYTQVLSVVPHSDLRREVRETLKRRQNWLGQ